MHINSKYVHPKRMHSFEVDRTMIEVHLPNKSLHAQQKLTWLCLNCGCDWI